MEYLVRKSSTSEYDTSKNMNKTLCSILMPDSQSITHEQWKLNLFGFNEKWVSYRQLENMYLIMENYFTLPKKAEGAFNKWSDLVENTVVPTS